MLVTYFLKSSSKLIFLNNFFRSSNRYCFTTKNNNMSQNLKCTTNDVSFMFSQSTTTKLQQEAATTTKERNNNQQNHKQNLENKNTLTTKNTWVLKKYKETMQKNKVILQKYKNKKNQSLRNNQSQSIQFFTETSLQDMMQAGYFYDDLLEIAAIFLFDKQQQTNQISFLVKLQFILYSYRLYMSQFRKRFISQVRQIVKGFLQRSERIDSSTTQYSMNLLNLLKYYLEMQQGDKKSIVENNSKEIALLRQKFTNLLIRRFKQRTSQNHFLEKSKKLENLLTNLDEACGLFPNFIKSYFISTAPKYNNNSRKSQSFENYEQPIQQDQQTIEWSFNKQETNKEINFQGKKQKPQNENLHESIQLNIDSFQIVSRQNYQILISQYKKILHQSQPITQASSSKEENGFISQKLKLFKKKYQQNHVLNINKLCTIYLKLSKISIARQYARFLKNYRMMAIQMEIFQLYNQNQLILVQNLPLQKYQTVQEFLKFLILLKFLCNRQNVKRIPEQRLNSYLRNLLKLNQQYFLDQKGAIYCRKVLSELNSKLIYCGWNDQRGIVQNYLEIK